MSCELFVEANFRPQTTELIDAANKILSEYAAQGFTLTLRQLFYQVVVRQLIPNSAESYGRLGRAMVEARRAGLVDWDCIEDRTRGLLGYKSWECPSAAVADAAAAYAEDLWIDQPYRPEVWVEKSALIGVIAPACGRWRVPHMAARGYPSHSELYAAGRRFRRHFAGGATTCRQIRQSSPTGGTPNTSGKRDRMIAGSSTPYLPRSLIN